MDSTRRDVLKNAALGGGLLLMGGHGLAQAQHGSHGQASGSKRSVSADVRAVRDAAKEELLRLVDQEGFELHAFVEALSAKSRISVKNLDDQTWHVKISKACGEGQDGYWEIPPGATEPWKRCIYHRVNIVLSADRETEEQSIEHIVMVSTGCNYFEINGGRLIYAGPDECA